MTAGLSTTRRGLVIRGRVYTLDPIVPVAKAIVVLGDRIVSVLADPDDAPAHASAVDIDDGCIMPAFSDAHVHLPSWALALNAPDLRGAATRGDALARVAAWDRANPDHRIVRGWGWSAETWAPDEPPTRAVLDAVSGNRPVILKSRDNHALWLNSAALALAGGDLDAPGGIVERAPDGELTGILRERAASRYERRFPATTEEALAALRAELPRLAAAGVVAVHDKDGHRGSLDVLPALDRAGELPLRVWQSLPAEHFEELGLEPVERARAAADVGVRVGYVKVFMDGTLGSRTARMLDGGGVEVTSVEQLRDIIRRAARQDLSVAVHAVGDRAVRDALDGFESTLPAWRPRGLRPRIEHAQCVHPDDLPRFATLGVAASVQFTHATSDRDLADALWASTTSRCYPYRALVDAGARLVGGSDAPYEAIDPLAGVRAAVLRTVDERPAWRPEERIGMVDAFAAFTRNPAWLEGADQLRGRIAQGFAADVVVLDTDPFYPSPGEAKVRATMLAGRWVHGGETACCG